MKDLVELLEIERLPAEDIAAQKGRFWIVREGPVLVAGIGLEQYGDLGLLRSLVTAREFRNRGMAARLLNHLMEQARSFGIRELYLLTETAESWFSKKGFEKINRNGAPEGIKGSAEFSRVCPASAVLMFRKI